MSLLLRLGSKNMGKTRQRQAYMTILKLSDSLLRSHQTQLVFWQAMALLTHICVNSKLKAYQLWVCVYGGENGGPTHTFHNCTPTHGEHIRSSSFRMNWLPNILTSPTLLTKFKTLFFLWLCQLKSLVACVIFHSGVRHINPWSSDVFR